jgi:hypothetical protein
MAHILSLSSGFVGSGPLVLLLDTILRIGPRPASWQRITLFQCVAVVQMAGMAAGLYLLSRSWRDLGNDYERCCSCTHCHVHNLSAPECCCSCCPEILLAGWDVDIFVAGLTY